MLSENLSNIKKWGIAYRTDIVLGVAIFLISIISFGLGRISVVWEAHPPVAIEIPPDSKTSEYRAAEASPSNAHITAEEGTASISSAYVASKNGTAYYLSTCSGAKRIKLENLITFSTKEEAEAAGYKPAGNCSGL